MFGKLAWFFAFLAVSQSVYGKTIEDVQKEALSQIKKNADTVKSKGDNIMAQLPAIKDNLAALSEGRKHHGSGITGRAFFQLQQIAASYQLINKFGNYGPDVSKCIEDKSNELQDVFSKITAILFQTLTNATESHMQKQNQVTGTWNTNYSKMLAAYTEKYQNLVASIPKLTSETQIAEEVANFQKSTSAMIELIESVLRDLKTVQMAAFEDFENVLEKMKYTTRKFVDLNGQFLDRCFYKAYLLESYKDY